MNLENENAKGTQKSEKAIQKQQETIKKLRRSLSCGAGCQNIRLMAMIFVKVAEPMQIPSLGVAA